VVGPDRDHRGDRPGDVRVVVEHVARQEDLVDVVEAEQDAAVHRLDDREGDERQREGQVHVERRAPVAEPEEVVVPRRPPALPVVVGVVLEVEVPDEVEAARLAVGERVHPVRPESPQEEVADQLEGEVHGEPCERIRGSPFEQGADHRRRWEKGTPPTRAALTPRGDAVIGVEDCLFRGDGADSNRGRRPIGLCGNCRVPCSIAHSTDSFRARCQEVQSPNWRGQSPPSTC
jgi:hypothetical protein